MASTAAVLCALIAGALAASPQAGSQPMTASPLRGGADVLQHPPPQPGRDRVTLDRAKVLGGAPADARIWVGGPGGAPLDASAATLALPLDSTVVVDVGGGPRREVRPDGPHYRMPYRIKQVREPAAGAGPEAAPTLVDAGEVDVFPVRPTLIWDGVKQGFFCTVRIGLLADGAARALAPPVTLLLRTSADTVLPAQLDFTSTNAYAEIELSDRGEHPSVELFVMPVGRPEGAEEPSVSLALERPALTVTVSPKRLQGFGLQTAEVVAQAATGAWPTASGATLTFSAGAGSLEPGQVAATGALARSRLRSSGVGSDLVRVEGAPFAPATYDVTYAFPTGFLCAALLGGVAGAIAAVRLRQKRSIRRRDLGTAAVTGLVAAVAYACGVNLVGIDLGSGAHEALVFTIGAVAALVGLPALKVKPRSAHA